MIPVTRPYLPDKNRYLQYIQRCYDTDQLTNNGPLVQELTKRLEDYLGVHNLLLVANGTLALQIAYKVLGISGNAITTPFTFAATSSSLLWEGIEPVYADIDPRSFNLSPEKTRDAIDPKTTALVPVHVFGNPCNVEAFERIAQEHNLKIVYDAAHAFGVNYKGKSILTWGDASMLSFHATKVFHTVEGGAIVFKRKEDYLRACRLINFGLENGDVVDVGINAKMSEFHAAMGLSVLDEIDTVFQKRKILFNRYLDVLQDRFEMPRWCENATRNYGYLPILFPTETELLKTQHCLNVEGIFPRRYFYPSLDTLGYYSKNTKIMANSREISDKVLCLPLYPSLNTETQNLIILKILSML
jgi:dTDP-4-amino-4,6-dideoxygalactose transaminase